MNKPQALYPGSFDPFTRGHEDIMVRASDEFDLSIGVAMNSGKNSTFTPQERVRLLQYMVPQHGIAPSKVVRIAGSTARWMKRNQVKTIVRGKRNMIDELDENALEYFNKLEYPEAETHVLDATASLQFASSSAAKMLLKANHDPSTIVSLNVEEALTSRILSQYPIYIAGGMGAGKSTIARSMILEARKSGINIKHIELDRVAHDIYTSLTDPIYQKIRSELRHTFGDHISPDGNWIDRARLSQELKIGERFDTEKLRQLDAIMSDPIEFRYKEMIEGFQGIIVIDGIIKEGLSFTRFAHHNVMFVDADKDIRVVRVMDRYANNQNPKSEEYIRSIMEAQLPFHEVEKIVGKHIADAHHGSIEVTDNSSSNMDDRAIFFGLLNQIDRYGELRTIHILSLLGIKGNMRDHLSYLQSRYNETHRYYHSWEHIVECLSLLFEMAIELSLSDEDMMTIGGAILGHDLLYIIDRDLYPQNEVQSQKIWSEYLKKYGVDTKYIKQISELILETRHGRVKISDRIQSSVLHDIDMSILGSGENRYAQYVSDIRSEFAPMMSGVSFDQARREGFLVPVLELGTGLYKTEYVRDIYGKRLMANIASELSGKI